MMLHTQLGRPLPGPVARQRHGVLQARQAGQVVLHCAVRRLLPRPLVCARSCLSFAMVVATSFSL